MYISCHTYYSLKYGTISPQEIIEEAEKNGVKTLVITDINNTSVAFDVLRRVQKLDLKILVGIDFRNGAKQEFIGIAKNNEGFYELNVFLSTHVHNKEDIPSKAPEFKNSWVVYPYGHIEPHELRENEFVGLRPNQVNKLLFNQWKNHQDKMVVLAPVTFRDKKDFNCHRILRAIDNNALLSQMPKTEQAQPDEIMMPEQELKEIFNRYPLLISNTEKILSTSSFEFDFKMEGKHNNKQTYTGNADLDFKFMRHLCYKGIPYRYKKVSERILKRIDKELNIIREKNYVSYFLIAWKIVKYARNRGYFYVGRGSGANSIASYLMRITDVDPIELDLYFERFINLFRKNPPDFDIDFSWKEREDVTDFIFRTFPNSTLLAAYSTFKTRSVIREIAKVFGLPEQEIKKMQKYAVGQDDVGRLIVKYAKYIQGFPSHLTVHSAGIIISEKDIRHYSATFMPPKGFQTTHFDMHIAEDIGLYKFDILGQRGLAKIKDTLSIIKENKPGITIDIHDIAKLKKDIPSNNLLKNAAAIGCFYVESPAMRMLLRKLHVDDYLALVAASSVIRPGVAQSGMMREYILRHRNMDRRKWAKKTFPILYELMPDTYGVMVYQEDVIKVAHHFAGLGLGEADVLRRGMSGKFRSRGEFQSVKDKFFSNCLEKGTKSEYTQDVWDQIESFAGYAFAKGHSASYAVESYQCLYLKAYYPLEFMVATVNNGGGFYSRELYLHEARRKGAIVELPCINQSDGITIIHDKEIYLGFGMINSLERQTVINILESRNMEGYFDDLPDFLSRVSISLEQLILLIKISAFRFTKRGKKELMWDAHLLLSKQKKTNPQASLFKLKNKEYTLPKLWQHELEDAYDEIELLGFMVSKSPFFLATELPHKEMRSRLFPNHLDEVITMIGYLVHIKGTKTRNGKRMNFGTFVDLEGEWIDTVSFPQIAAQYPFKGPGCYVLQGKVTEEFGFYSLELSGNWRIPSKNLDEVQTTRLKPV
ncbi:MAG: DNA-directed DNA polymerase III PolC [Patiriisocius sp.]